MAENGLVRRLVLLSTFCTRVCGPKKLASAIANMHGYSTGAVRWSDSHFPGTSYRYMSVPAIWSASYSSSTEAPSHRRKHKVLRSGVCSSRVQEGASDLLLELPGEVVPPVCRGAGAVRLLSSIWARPWAAARRRPCCVKWCVPCSVLLGYFYKDFGGQESVAQAAKGFGAAGDTT